MRKKLTSIIASSLVAGICLAGSGCTKNPIKVLDSHKCEEIIRVKRGDTYWGYAKMLQKKYPNKLDDLDIRDVWMYLRDYNNGKDLIEGDEIKIPECY